MQNYKIIIAYDGRRYKGYRKTKTNSEQSIQGKLEAILYKLYEKDIEVISAVNTDAGVSAHYQVVNFHAPDIGMDEKGIYEYFETYLPDDIITLSVEKVDERFHSRYLARQITYTYRLWKKNAPRRPLFERQLVNVMDKPLDVTMMREGAKVFLGSHDFAAYATKSKSGSTIKEIQSMDIEETDVEVIITMTANGYLLNMERYIVGTLIQIGFLERKVDSIHRGFKTRDNKDVGHKAMAHALCLKKISYE
ncbi:tRNA pseudouridine synthase A [Petrocella sp. FN5]|uniref:tRNA pseudouridine synthase A n=1 Tax=Petrocella sp. FN5 TaxID=3032002 RepID=UPI0023DB1D8F|nr:tRNA pseudouridine(38-40) synthase TruA [Petrocella sp. FN5]MDF1616770.1 tRNA pseudouridine(38-40) synthase TruA [Petrocella sp. FN5]